MRQSHRDRRTPRHIRNVAHMARCARRSAIGVRGDVRAGGRRAGRGRRHLHSTDAPCSQPDLLGRAVRQVERPPAHERSAIIDSHHHRPAGIRIRHPHVRAQRQRFRRRSQSLGIVSLAATGAPSRKSRPVPRRDLGPRSSIIHRRRRIVACGRRRCGSEILRRASGEQKREHGAKCKCPKPAFRADEISWAPLIQVRFSRIGCGAQSNPSPK